MFKHITAALVLALALSSPAEAFRPGSRMGGGFGGGGFAGGGGGSNFRMPIPETEIRDAATVLQLCSHPEILKTMNSALSRNHMKVERITRYPQGGKFGYKFVLVPLTPPPAGIHAGGYFTATMSRAGELEEVSKVTLQK